MDLGRLGQVFMAIGLLAVLVGAVLVGLAALGIGRLPGDISVRRGNLRIYVPLASSVVISVVLTVLLNLFIRR